MDFYGNEYNLLSEIAIEIEEENIPGYKSEIDNTNKVIINTLAPPVVRVNPNLRMRISEDH